jgi:ubiquinol-cytochrome c reductase core subunit 2
MSKCFHSSSDVELIDNLASNREYFAEVLGDVVSSSKLLPHEFYEEVIPQSLSEYEQALNLPSVLGFDHLTQTAYRQKGLGASLFSSPASPISHKQITDYAHSVFAKDNMAVVASGIESSHLSKLVSTHFKNVRSTKGNVTAGSKQYFGGDARISFVPNHAVDGPRAHYGHYLIAFEGAGLDASPELAILRSHLGGESSVKWSNGLSPLSQIGDKVASANANAFNLNFTDSGLFGVYLTAPTEKVVDAAKEATKAIKEATKSISKEDLAKAKAKASFEAAAAVESRAGIHAAVGGQLLESNKVQLLEETFSKIEGISASALASAASKLLDKKPTTVAVGDVHKLPYADECF